MNMFKLSFKGLLIASISILVALSVGTSNLLSFLDERDTLQDNLYKNTEKRISLEAEKLHSYLASRALATANLASDYEKHQYRDGHAERVRISAISSDVVSMLVSFKNGDAYASYDYPGWIEHKAPSSYDPRKRPWYNQAKNNPGKVIYTDVYADATTKQLMISIGKAFDGGVTLADITLDVLNEVVQGIKIPGSVSIVMADDSTALASTSDSIATGKKLSDNLLSTDTIRTIKGKEYTTQELTLAGKENVLFSHKIALGNKNLYLLTSLDKEIVFADIEKTKQHAIIMTCIYVIVCVVLAVLILNYLYRPILALKTTMTSLASGDGDLTQRLEVKSDDDLGQIAASVNTFIENLQTMMLEIENSTLRLKDDVEALNIQSQNNSDILAQHLIETEQIVTAIEEMNATAENVAQHAAETAASTEEASTMGTESREVVAQAQSNVTSLMNVVGETADKIQNMSTETQEINSILSVIGDIADQTNLLALNAAIEAARAGEQGRGFAVVADEVRALASRTQVSTGEIEKALESLMNGSKATSSSMDSTKITCDETFKSTEQVDTHIHGLTDHITKIHDLSVQIATAAEEQSNVTHEVSKNMTSINSIVNQLNATGQETAVQTENIHKINLDLSNIIGKFKLRS